MKANAGPYGGEGGVLIILSNEEGRVVGLMKLEAKDVPGKTAQQTHEELATQVSSLINRGK